MHIKPNESSIFAVKLFMKYFTPFFDVNIKNKNLIENFFHGAELKSFVFKKYKSKNKLIEIKFNIISKDQKFNYKRNGQ